MQNLPIDLPDPRGMGSTGQKSTFSEHGNIVYQIKGNLELSNVIENILHAYPSTHDPREWVKSQLFPNMGMLHIKLKGITCSKSVANI